MKYQRSPYLVTLIWLRYFETARGFAKRLFLKGQWRKMERYERTNYPREVAEMALAHAVGDKVEAAYRRGDLFEKRRRLASQWATFCETSPTAKVISMHAKQKSATHE